MKIILSIAGSDSSSGAGIQADLKTAQSMGVYCMTVLTAVTSQNSHGVDSVFSLPAEWVKNQLEVVLNDITPHAVKIGMASNSKLLNVILEIIKNYKLSNIVFDPVLYSKNNVSLLDKAGMSFLLSDFLPSVYLLMPNLDEACMLAGTGEKVYDKESVKKICRVLFDKGVQNVLVKGGHFKEEALDILYTGMDFYEFRSDKIPGTPVHGTGCIFSTAVAAGLALDKDLITSISSAKDYINKGIVRSLRLGKGYRFFNH